MAPIATPAIERLWQRVEFGDWLDCWLWTGADNGDGYGQIHENGRTAYTHRVAYEALVGPIPGGLVVDHVVEWGCGDRRCVNPLHMEVVTHKVNLRRGVGPTAIHAAKTHCPKGHPYDEENTYIDKRGSRVCRTCRREDMRARRCR